MSGTHRSGTRRRRRGRTRWAALVVVTGLATLGAAGCTKPHDPPPPPPTEPPRTGGCHSIDFEKASVDLVSKAGEAPRYELTVSGTKRSISQTVELVPVTYIRQPEYWAIEVVGCDPAVGLPALGPYTVTLDLTGTIGTEGIEVVGATRTQRFDIG